MASILRQIKLKLDKKSADDAAKAMQDALKKGTDPKKPKDNLSDIEKSVQSLKLSVMDLAKRFLPAISAAVIGRKIIQSSVDAEAAYAQLANAVRLTGDNAGFTVEQLVALSNEMERNSTTSASAVQGGLQRLLSYTNIQGEAFTRTAQSALDMSEALGMDMVQAAETLGSALDDPIRGLGRLEKQNFRFTKSEKEVIAALVEANDLFGAQTLILDTLDEFYDRAAKTARETLGGAITALGNEIGNQMTLSAESSGLLAGAINLITDNLKELVRVARDALIVMGSAKLVLVLRTAALAFTASTFTIGQMTKAIYAKITALRAFQLAMGPAGVFTIALSGLAILALRSRDALNDIAKAAEEAKLKIQDMFSAGDLAGIAAELAVVETELAAARQRLDALKERGPRVTGGQFGFGEGNFQASVMAEEASIRRLQERYESLTSGITQLAIARQREREEADGGGGGGAGAPPDPMRWAETHKQFGIITRTAIDANREWAENNFQTVGKVSSIWGEFTRLRLEQNQRIAEDMEEASRRMEQAALDTAFNMADAFQPFFDAMAFGLLGIGDQAQNMKESFHGVGAAIVAELIKGKAEYNLAEALGKLATGTWPPNPAALKSAALHFSAAAAFKAISAKGGGGSKGGSGTSGMPNPGSTMRPSASSAMGAEINIYIDPLNPSNPAWQSTLAQTLRGVSQRYGASTVNVKPRTS
jgi:hypothetical protein